MKSDERLEEARVLIGKTLLFFDVIERFVERWGLVQL